MPAESPGSAVIASTIAQNNLQASNPGWKAVHHKSRSPVSSERTNKVKGESLAIYSGILMNRQYLYRTPFTVMTNNSALPGLYNSRRQASHRVERYRGRLGMFQFKVQYVLGDKNPCDYGSRHLDAVLTNLTVEQ